MTIGTDTLAAGGKLNPASMPGGSELIDKPPRQKATVITDTIKIRNVDTYDPADVSDAVLRDDLRIVLAWWAQARRGVDIPHDRETLIRLATAIVAEAVRRGPDVIRFNPPGMTTGARELFELAARRVGVPRPMIKRLEVGPELEPSELATVELLEAHGQLHRIHKAAAPGSAEAVVDVHARVVDEMARRGQGHPAPPDEGLDGASEPLEAVSAPVVGMTTRNRHEASADAPAPLVRIEPGTVYPQPAAPTYTGNPHAVTALVEQYRDADELLPVLVQKRVGGMPAQIHRVGDSVRVLAEGSELTDTAGPIVAAVKALEPDPLVLEVELVSTGEQWAARVTDLPLCKGALHTEPLEARVAALEALELPAEGPLTVAPGVRVSDLCELERAARAAVAAFGSCGVTVRSLAAEYPLAAVPLEGCAAVAVEPVQVTKAADPYVEYPPEDARRRFVVQNHWRGKSLHADVRLELRPDLALGWTLNTQKPGVVKEPVTTLEQAEAWRKRMGEVSKIDWRNGKWPERGGDGAPRAAILAERKGPHAHAWLDVEGASKPAKEGEPPPAGATVNFPAVYSIEDKGTVEYGAQKPWLHEYFFNGDALNYRVFFRLLQLGEVKKALHSHSSCMSCKAAPKVDVIWADGRGRAWFCKGCFGDWLRKMGGRRGAEVVRERQIIGPAAPTEFGEVHKAVEVAKAAEAHPVCKALPPGEEREGGGKQWLAIYPDDPVPYVLGDEAVRKAWMPPPGVSALPSAVRSQIPSGLRYWKWKAAGGEARRVRDELHRRLKAGEVKVDWQAVYKRVQKAEARPIRWVLQQQTVGSAPPSYWLRMDLGEGPLVVLRMYGSPLEGGRVVAELEADPRRDSIAAEGVLPVGHRLNTSKSGPSDMAKLDSGSGQMLSWGPDQLIVRLKGSELSGLFGATRVDGGWVWASGEAAKTAGVDKRAEALADASRFIPVLKVDRVKRLVTGVVLEPGEIDAHNDFVPVDVVERAAHRFLATYNSDTRLGLMHKQFGDVGIELVESWLAPADMRIGGERVKKGTWLLTVRVLDSALWSKVKRGEFSGFSIGGIARVPG